MSIPLVQEATKDAINTSIIAIKRNIERINMLLGLVDNDSPDLSGFATKQELQDAVTELQPVDEVTVGNMQSVTSNAVARMLKSVEFSGTTDGNGELEVTSFLPPNAIPVCVASTVGGNIKITPVNYYNLQGQFTGNSFWVQVFNDMNNTFRSYFSVSGIIFYIEKF